MSNSSAMQKRLCKMTVKACSLRAAYTIVSIGRAPYRNESNETPGILTNPPSLYIIKYILVYTIQKEEQA